jgi:hypothetical protein
MDMIHKAHFAFTAVLMSAVAYGAVKVASIPRQRVYEANAAALAAVTFGKHSYAIIAGSGSGELPYAIRDAIRAQGGTATVDGATPFEGIFASPTSVARDLSKAIGGGVRARADDAYEIDVGTPPHEGN